MKTIPTLVGLITVFYFAACSDNGSSAEAFNAAKVCPESGRGTFVDERDGQEYRYTTIGNQVWMALEAGKEPGGSDECAFDLIPAKHSSQNAEGLFSDIWTGTLRTDGGYSAYVVRFQFNSNGVNKMTQFLDKYTLGYADNWVCGQFFGRFDSKQI